MHCCTARMTTYVRRGLKRGKVKTREHPGTPQQPSMGEAPVALPGVGRLVEGEDVEEIRAARLDGWIAWEAEERVAQ